MTNFFHQVQYLRSTAAFQQRPIRSVSRLAMWGARCLCSRGTILRLEGTQTRLALPPIWNGHPKLIYSFGWNFEPELPFLMDALKGAKSVIDIGANIGLWSVLMARALGEGGHVYAFEPTSETFGHLTRNIGLNECHVTCIHEALSDRNGTIRLHHDEDATKNSIGETVTQGKTAWEEVTTRTLDSFVASSGLKELDFIKMDVEGAEPMVLGGAEVTLQRFKPALLFEINPVAMHALGFNHDESWRRLASYGYCFYTVKNGLSEITETPPWGDVWAVHPAGPTRLSLAQMAAALSAN